MKHAENAVVNLEQDGDGPLLRRATRLQLRFDQLDVPVGVLVPEEVIQPVGRDVEPERGEGRVQLTAQLAGSGAASSDG